MSFGFLGIQFGFALQGGFMSRIFQTLGASVIDKNQFWNIIDDLKALGAQGILICPIEKMVL